jgi:hypothetical protein
VKNLSRMDELIDMGRYLPNYKVFQRFVHNLGLFYSFEQDISVIMDHNVIGFRTNVGHPPRTMSRYGQQHVTLYTCSSILTLMPLK